MSFRKFLKWLFASKKCRHKWKEIKSFEIVGDGVWSAKDTIGHVSKLQCKRCGDIKFEQLKLKEFWD